MQHGSDSSDRAVLVDMKRSGHPRWKAFLQTAYDLDMSYDEAVDEWFSPEM